ACSLVDLEKLIPSTAIDVVNSDGNLLNYVPNACPNSVIARIFSKHDQVSYNARAVPSALPPELAQHPVVQTLVSHAQYVSASAVRSAALVLNQPAPSAPGKPPSRVGLSEVHDFANLVMDRVVRHTPSATATPDPATEKFWNNLKTYYSIYFQGNFKTYTGAALTKPSLSLTISDTEIVQSVQIFMEFLLDEILQSPVWEVKDSSNKVTAYYPAGTTNKPTYLVVNSTVQFAAPDPLPTGPTGCGMNVLKAQAIDLLVKEFTTAASAEVGLLAKSIGGIEVGLGVLGKLSIGDNNLLSELVKGVSTEVVTRLTIALAVPILSAIDFEQQPAILAKVQGPLSVTGPKSAVAAKTAQLRIMTSPFVSASIKGL